MGNDLKVAVILSLKNGQFVGGMAASENQLKRFEGSARRSAHNLSLWANKVAGLTTLFGTLGVGMAAKSVIDFDTRLARLAIAAGLSRRQMFELKDELLAFGRETFQAPEDLLSGMEQIVEKTGDFKFAVGAIKDLGIVSSATGASVADIGSTASDLNEKFGVTKDRVLAVFDILDEQGKQGAFTLQNMAAYFPQLLSAAAGFGVTGEKGLRTFGAFLQMARRGTGTSAEASTAVERSFSDMIAKYKVIKSLTGFDIFDPEKSKKQGRKVTKDLDVVLKEIIKRSKGDVTKLQKIFGEEAIRAIRPLAASFQKFGDFRDFDRFVEMGGSGATVLRDFSFWSEQTAAKLRALRTEFSTFANQNLAGPIEGFTGALGFLNRHPTVTKGGLWAGLGLAGIGVGAKLYGAGKGAVGTARALGGAAAASEALPWIGAGLAGAAIGGVIGTGINKAMSYGIEKWTGGKSKDLGELLWDKLDHTSPEADARFEKAILRAAAVEKKAAAIEVAQAAGPGPASGGNRAREDRLPDVKNDITINVAVDREGNPFVVTDANRAAVNVAVNRGSFLGF